MCEKLEAPSWVGFVVAAVLGGLYHSVFMQVDMIGTKAAPLVDLDYIQGEYGDGACFTVICLFKIL